MYVNFAQIITGLFELFCQQSLRMCELGSEGRIRGNQVQMPPNYRHEWSWWSDSELIGKVMVCKRKPQKWGKHRHFDVIAVRQLVVLLKNSALVYKDIQDVAHLHGMQLLHTESGCSWSPLGSSWKANKILVFDKGFANDKRWSNSKLFAFIFVVLPKGKTPLKHHAKILSNRIDIKFEESW